RPCRRPVHAGREAVADWSQRCDLGRKEPGLRDLPDLHMACVALLLGLAPERCEVRRYGKRVEDLAVLGDEPGDLRAVVIGAVLVGAGVDDRVAGTLEQGCERTP